METRGAKKYHHIIHKYSNDTCNLIEPLFQQRVCTRFARNIAQKTSFYFIEVYVGRMMYLLNNECIRLSCARHYKMFKDFYKLINFPWTFHIRIILTLIYSFTDSLLTEKFIVVVKVLYITLYFLMLDWHAFIVALHCCHFYDCKKYHFSRELSRFIFNNF